MEITIRSATEADAQACGRICYEGFRAVTDRHGYPPVFASIEVATRRLAAFLANPSVFGLVAELAGNCDDIISLATPEPFFAVGAHYRDFTQTEDDEVIRLLDEARQWTAEPAEPSVT